MVKQKSLADTRKWKELRKKIVKARKDPEFKEFIREFIKFHSGKSS